MYSPPKVWVQGPAAKEPQAKTPYLPGLPMALPLGELARKRLRGYKKAHRHSPVTDCQCALRHFVLFRPALFGSILSGGGGILTEQQTLVLVQLLLTAAQINSHSSQRTSHSSQRCDNSDQTGFLHRFSTLLFGRTSGPAIFSGRSAAQARSILKLLYPDFTKITTKKAKFCFFQSPSFFLYALNAPGRVYSFCSCSRLAQTQPAGASALPTQAE